MPHIWFPAFMIALRRFSILIAAVLALIVYLGVYNATESTQLATLAVVIVMVFWIGTVILVLRSFRRR